MTSVDSASRTPPMRPSSPAPDARATQNANPNDVRAMREAIDAARSKLDKSAGPPGKRMPVTAEGERPRGGEVARQGHEVPVARLTQQQRDGTEALAGWNGQGGAIGAAPVQASFPPPHVDPSAFAQMLADLWTRENGRGSKEVRVRFGDRAWPATGALLVRNAAGSLDVALFVGDGGRAYGDRLPGLEDALTSAGVDLGTLAIENGV